MARHTPLATTDPDLAAIDHLEALIVAGRLQTLAFHDVDPEEFARERAAVTTLAAAVRERMRAEYLARQVSL